MRRSLDLHLEIARTKAVVQSEHLEIDRWFASEDGLILRIKPTEYLTRTQKETIIRRLKALPGVEWVTTASASAGQVQPVLLANGFASDAAISEARLRGFRDFDKTAHEARIKPDAARTRGVLFVKTKPAALFGPGAAAQVRATAAVDHTRLGGRIQRVLKDTETERTEVIEFDENQVSLIEMIRRYHALPWVEYAEPQYLGYLMDTPVNDPFANGADGAHLDRIQARRAWDIKHDTNQVVAVIDTGLHYNHPDIKGNDPGRPNGNVFSDLSGTNFVGPNPNDPNDDQIAAGGISGHGTHVAGIIGALANNGIGSTGVAWKAQLLPFKIFDQNSSPGPNYNTDVATAIDRAVLRGARIINMSFGGGGFSQVMADAIRGNSNNENAKAAMVVAAGNRLTCAEPSPTPEPVPDPVATPGPNDHGDPRGRGDVDAMPVYPTSYPYPNLIAVANTDSTDTLVCHSFYGSFTVDLAAPGTAAGGAGVISTLNAQASAPYGPLTGTSQAAPHVSGALALVRETFPNSTAFEMLDRIRMGVDVLAGLSGNTPSGQLRDYKGHVSTGGRLNAFRALLPRSKLANVSTRAKVETGAGIAINGFILRGATTVVVRGIGPSLGNQGVSGSLADPYLQLFDQNGIMIAENNNWRDTQEAAIQATGIQPTNDLESAIVANLQAGAYTIHLTGVGGGQGVGLNEIYELSGIADPTAPPDPVKDLQRTQNLSSRVMVRGGDQLAILGTIVTGRGIPADPTANPPRPETLPPSRRVAFRALGPSLIAAGVSNALADPKLELFDGNGVMLAQNNSWKAASPIRIYEDKITEAGLAPAFDQEAVIIATLAPGAYTALCRGADGGEGIALVEMYEY